MKFRALGFPLAVHFRHPFDCAKLAEERVFQKGPTAMNIGDFNRVIDVGDDRHTLGVNQPRAADEPALIGIRRFDSQIKPTVV